MNFVIKEEVILDILNELVVDNQDAQEIYETAVTVAENQYLQQIFETYAKQRRQFVRELSQVLIQHGDEPTDTGTLNNLFHRAWINMNAALRSGDNAILAECIRGEKASLANYQSALHQDLPDDLRAIIQPQASLIRSELEHLQTLKKAFHNI